MYPPMYDKLSWLNSVGGIDIQVDCGHIEMIKRLV